MKSESFAAKEFQKGDKQIECAHVVVDGRLKATGNAELNL